MPFISAGGTSLVYLWVQLVYYVMWGKVRKVAKNLRKSKMAINLFKSKKKKESDF